MTDKPNLPGYNVSDITQVDSGGGESKYDSYWAYLKSENAPVDDPNYHNAEQIIGWAKAANPKNVSDHGKGFLDFHDALTKLNFSAGHDLDLPALLLEVGKELHQGWHGGATAAPEAQRQLTLLYSSAKDLMDTSLQAGYALKGHGDHALPEFKNHFDGDNHDLDVDTAKYIEGDWKTENYDKYPALQGMNHTKQDELDLGKAQMAAMTAYRDKWAREKLVAHNTNVTSSYDGMPYMLNLSFPPGTKVPPPPPPPRDTQDHGGNDDGGSKNHGGNGSIPSFNGGGGDTGGTGGMPHMPSSSNLAGLGNTGNGSGTNLSGVGHQPIGTDLSGIGNDGLGGGPGGTSLGQGGTGLGNGPGGTGLGGNPSGFPSVGPIGLGGGGGGFGGLPKGGLGSDPLGLKSPGGGGTVQEAGGTIGARGALNGAAAAEEAAMGNAAANAARGAGGMMPMMPPMAGQGGQKEGRERGTWLTEDEDVWGTDDDVAPPLIG